MKKNTALIIFLLLVTCYSSPIPIHAQTPDTIGSIEYNTGVSSGKPMFTITNFLPGDYVSKNVVAKNIGSVPAKSSIKINQTSQTRIISQVLQVMISANNIPIYGGTSPTGTKTLSDFFADSASSIFGLPLTQIPPNQSTTYKIAILMPNTAGNQFQNASATFDIKFGITVDLPVSCQNLTFDNVLFGTNAGDIINGTEKKELILGFGGNDVIHGNGGNDCVMGSDGSDILYGEGSNDTILGGPGNDILFGGQSNDSLFGQEGTDILFGDSGNDYLDGGHLQDVLFGGDDTDKCEANISFLCEQIF